MKGSVGSIDLMIVMREVAGPAEVEHILARLEEAGATKPEPIPTSLIPIAHTITINPISNLLWLLLISCCTLRCKSPDSLRILRE